MRLLAALGIALLLAGCANGTPREPEPSLTGSSSATATSPPIQEVARFTDTLYLTKGGKFDVAVPGQAEGFRLRMAPDSEPTSADLRWTMDRPDLATITANGTFWYEITGAVYNSGNDCFIGVQLFLEDGSSGAVTTHCIAGPVTPTSGIYRVDFGFTWPIDSLQGDEFGLLVGASAVYGLDGDVSLLGGSLEHPSHLTIAGLQLPLESNLRLLVSS